MSAILKARTPEVSFRHAEEQRVFPSFVRRIIIAPHSPLLEARALVQLDRRRIGRPHLEVQHHAFVFARFLHREMQQVTAQPLALPFALDGDVEQMRFVDREQMMA